MIFKYHNYFKNNMIFEYYDYKKSKDVNNKYKCRFKFYMELKINILI